MSKKNVVEKFRLQLQNRKSKKDPRNTPRAFNKEFYQQFLFFSLTWNLALNKNKSENHQKTIPTKPTQKIQFHTRKYHKQQNNKNVTRVVSSNGQTNKDSQKPIAKKMRFQHQKC